MKIVLLPRVFILSLALAVAGCGGEVTPESIFGNDWIQGSAGCKIDWLSDQRGDGGRSARSKDPHGD